MSGLWFEVFRPVCEEVCATGGYAHAPVVLFYVARWRQKGVRESEPDGTGDQREVLGIVERIARNLSDDGARVDRLFEGDADELTALRHLLLSSAGPRAGDAAYEFADEALQKISLVLLTGTPPSRAEKALAMGPDGPANEYIFTSPFPYWAKKVVINLIKDEHRREKRRRQGPVSRAGKKPVPATSDGDLRRAFESLPQLLDAIRGLPKAQRSVMVMSLCRRDVDDLLLDDLRDKAPDLFTPGGPRPASDTEIAELLRTTPRLVAANRSAARRKLVDDPRWAQLLDALLPHRTTAPARSEENADG
jgi:hypothetical protein